MALITTTTLSAWRGRFVALNEQLAGLVRDLAQMQRGLQGNAVLEVTPELAATFIASMSAISRTADAIRAELAKAVAKHQDSEPS